MLAKDILKSARFILSDTSKERWSDARLLSLLNDGVIDVAKQTTIFVEAMIVVLTNLVTEIDVSTVSTKIVRAEYLDQVVPFHTYEEMDHKFGKNWQSDRGTELQALIYGKQKNSLLKTYPIIENAQNSNIEYSSNFGVITDISYSDIQPVMFDHYGDISGIPDNALVKLFYVRRHEKIDDINIELKIDELCLEPLAHYVAGRAFRDNQDTQNRAMGNEELQFYYAMIEEYSMEKARNFVRVPTTSVYRPMGE